MDLSVSGIQELPTVMVAIVLIITVFRNLATGSYFGIFNNEELSVRINRSAMRRGYILVSS